MQQPAVVPLLTALSIFRQAATRSTNWPHLASARNKKPKLIFLVNLSCPAHQSNPSLLAGVLSNGCIHSLERCPTLWTLWLLE
jgi:hypothetical protein